MSFLRHYIQPKVSDMGLLFQILLIRACACLTNLSANGIIINIAYIWHWSPNIVAPFIVPY